MTARFSKMELAKWAIERRNILYADNDFDRGNGTAQVERSTPDRNRQYGRIMALDDLIDKFNLEFLP